VFISSLAKSLSGLGLSGLLLPEARVTVVNALVQDCVDEWKAYQSKLAEFCRKIAVPLRFVSILKDLVTLDPVGFAKGCDRRSKKWLGAMSRFKERAFGFVRGVREDVGYWRGDR
jgi:hypothetical protein